MTENKYNHILIGTTFFTDNKRSFKRRARIYNVNLYLSPVVYPPEVVPFRSVTDNAN